DGTGRGWRDSNDKLRAMRSCRAIERAHGLAVVDDRRPSQPKAMVTASERERAKRHSRTQRREVVPERFRLRQLVGDAAAAAAAGTAEFATQLHARGVLYEPNTSADPQVRGYKFS